MTPPAPRFDGRAVIVVGLVCGVAGLGLFIGGLLLARERTMVAYLTAYLYALSLAIGALLWLLLTAAMGATWPVVVRRIAEAIVGTLPLLAVLLLPILLELPVLYPWVHPSTIADSHAREIVERKLAYLNVPFFVARAGFYFVVLLVVGELVRGWSLRQDHDGFRARARIRLLSVGTFGPVLLVVSFLAFDWIMSTFPEWASSIFGLYYASGAILGAACLVFLLAMIEARAGILRLHASHRYAFGRTLLTFLLVWAYLGFFQLLLIWIANKPDEQSWYVVRLDPGWYWMTIICILVLHFWVPFPALLSYRVKKSAGALSCVAVWLLALHYLDVYWLVQPSLRRSEFGFDGMDVAMLFGVCGLCVAFGAWRMRGRPLAAWRDPSFERALRYTSI